MRSAERMSTTLRRKAIRSKDESEDRVRKNARRQSARRRCIAKEHREREAGHMQFNKTSAEFQGE